MSFILE